MKKYFNLFILSVAVFSLSSCLKDDKAIIQADMSPAVVEFRNPIAISSPSGAVYPMYSKAFGLDAATVNYSLTIAYTGATPAPQDIPVTIDIFDAAIATYNTQQSTSLTVMPTSLYTLNTPSATIAKGTFFTTINLTFKPQSFDFTKTYGLAVRIKSATGATISSNFGTIIMSLGAKNKYDGLYTVKEAAPMTDATNSAFTGLYPMEKMSLITTGANTVAMYDGQYAANNYAHPFLNAGSTSYYGSFAPVFTMDPTTGAVTSVVNYFGQPSSNGRSAQLNPAGVNKFTINADGSKTLEVSYYMLQPGTTIRTSFYEKWTYTGVRP